MSKLSEDKHESTMTIREFFSLLALNCVALWHNTVDFLKVVCRYYHSKQFLKTDISLLLMYLFHNPFSISKRFLMNKGEEDIYAYGETPLASLDIIAKEAQIGSNDRVYELGAGRGRSCFWLHSFCGCTVLGIEHIPEFVERANRIKNKLKIDGVDFICADICDVDYSEATVCYLYGTCLDDKTIKKLVNKFSKLPSGTKIITVSYPLTEYTEKTFFEVMKRFTVPYTWGEADVFIHLVK